MITVTYLSPWRVWRHTCSSTPITATPSKRDGSEMSTRRPSSSTAVLAQFHDTSRASAIRAMVRCWHTIAASAQRSPPRGDLRPRLRRGRHVLAPHMATTGTVALFERVGAVARSYGVRSDRDGELIECGGDAELIVSGVDAEFVGEGRRRVALRLSRGR